MSNVTKGLVAVAVVVAGVMVANWISKKMAESSAAK